MEESDEKIMEGVPSPDSDRIYEIELAKAGGSLAERRTVKKEAFSEDLGEGVLTLDVYRTSAEVVVESAIAGVDPENIDIDVTTDSITIRGERHRVREVKEDDYDLQECYWGRFSRSIILPEEVDAEGAKAEFKNGILIVRMPKKGKAKSKKLKVNSD